MTWLRVLPVLGLACGDPAAGSDAESSGGETTTSSSSGGDDTSSSGNGESTGGPDPCTTALGTGAAPIYTRPEGVFTLRITAGYTNLLGHVGAAPQPDFHTETQRQGACRLLRYDGDACTTRCLPPSLCVDGACVELPTFVSAGELTLEGVGDAAVTIPEDGVHQYFWEIIGDPALSMPRLLSTGGDVSAFDLSSCPITAPMPTEDWSALLEARAPGEDVVLTWSDPIDTARVQLRMTTGIGTHGGISPVELECEGPDLGTLVLPGAFLDALYAEGWSCGECGGNELVRYHADQTDAPPPTIQLRVSASTGFWYIP